MHVYVCKCRYVLSAYIHFHSQNGVSDTKSNISLPFVYVIIIIIMVISGTTAHCAYKKYEKQNWELTEVMISGYYMNNVRIYPTPSYCYNTVVQQSNSCTSYITTYSSFQSSKLYNLYQHVAWYMVSQNRWNPLTW